MTPAGFWRRLGAQIMDGLIISIPMLVLFPLLFATHAIGFGTRPWLNLAFLAVAVVYYVGFLSSRWQATPGKRIMGVYIVHAGDGRRLTWLRTLARYAVFNLPYLFYAVIPLLMGINPSMPPGMSAEDMARMQSVMEKQLRDHQPMTAQDQQFMRHAMDASMTAGLPEADKLRYSAIEDKMAQRQPLTVEETEFQARIFSQFGKRFYSGPLFMLGAFSMLYMVALALTVALTREKTGIHDMACSTRAVLGKPDGLPV